MTERATGATIWTDLQTRRSDRFDGVGRWGTYTADAQLREDIRRVYIGQRVATEGARFLEDINRSAVPGPARRELDEAAVSWYESLGPRQRRKHGL